MAPTEKKGPKKAYERFQYTEKDMQNALKAAQSGMSISSAATKYNVPKSTLHGRYTCKVPDQRKMGPKSILTEAEEDRLEKWILGKAQVGFPMHPDEVKDAVQRVMEEYPRKNPFTNNRPGEKWMDLFLKRHPEIRKKNTEIISKARACVTEEGLRQWFAETRAFLKENDALDILNRPHSIFNGDETGVQTCPKSGLLLGAKSEKNFYEIANGKEKECITVLCTFSAAGESIPPMIVFPYKRIPAYIAQSVPDGWPIGRSDSGWMIHATFYEYVANVFYPWCVENNVQFPVLYFLDGHKSHISAELREFCVEHAIILYCLPPNSTHIMQPCDVTIFKPLKSHWKKVVSEHKQQTEKSITKANFALLFKKAFDRLSVKVDTIQNGFKTCGLYPFDENAVNYSKCISTRRANLHQMSEEESSISTEDFASTKKVIEHIIGSAKTKSFVKMRNTIQNKNATDPLFKLWTICTDHVEGIHVPNDEENIPNTVVQAQQNAILISDNAMLQEVEDSISFPIEELTDPNSGLPIYNIVTEDFTQEERNMINNDYTSLALDETCLKENDETIVCEYAVDILHEENNNFIKIHEANIEKEGYSDGNGDKIDENEHASSTTHQQENAQSETVTEEKNNLPNKNENNKYNMSQDALSSQKNAVPIEEIWEKHLKWPEFEKKEQQKTNKKQQTLPYAITSSKWKNYYELVKQEQEEKERKAAERLVMQKIKKESVEAAKAEKMKARAEKAKEKEEKAKMKEEAKMKREQTPKPKTQQRAIKRTFVATNDSITAEDPAVNVNQKIPKNKKRVVSKSTPKKRKLDNSD